MNKYPILLQDEEKSCGAYCIKMVLEYYGYQEEIVRIKNKARLNQNGISIKGMIECLKSYQIEAKAYEATLEDICQHIHFPCILYMIEGGIGHFVVLYAIKDDEYVIGDPAKGLVTYYEEEMNERYGRCVIDIIHVGRVSTGQYHTYLNFLRKLFLSYQSLLLSCLLKGLGISVLGYLSSYFFQWIIDEIHRDTHMFYMIMICVVYGVIEMIKVFMEKKKEELLIGLQRALDEDLVFQSSMNMLSLPFSFFYQEKGYIQSELLSLFDLSEMSLLLFERFILDGLSFIVFLIGMMFINIYMSMIVMMMFMIIIFYMYHRFSTLQTMNKEYLEQQFNYHHHILELIENHFLIKRFSLQQVQRERSFTCFDTLERYKEEKSLYLNHIQTTNQYIIYSFYTILLIVGFYFFHIHQLTIGRLMMFYMLVSYCIQPLIHMIALSVEYTHMKFIYDKYKSFQYIEERKDLYVFNETLTSIRFDNVAYAYGYQLPLFEHIDWMIDHHFLLKGKTGCGKSTLLRLLMGYDLEYSGDIYMNDHELRTIDLSSLYQHIGYTNETPSFLHMSLYENFLCTDEKLIKNYLKIFGQEELISMFHMILDENGNPLSLGQRQVVALIRLLCQNYDVLILDEAFSHMDSYLAGKILRYLLKNDEGKIYVMVNHQMRNTFKNVDSIILEKGSMKH